MKNASITVKNLNFSWPCGRRVLDNISLHISAGERVALIGPNGAGKSSLLLHLNGLLPDGKAADGEIYIDDVPLVAERMGEVRRKVGMVFQDPDDQLFCESVGEDVAYGPRQLEKMGGEPFDQQALELTLAEVGLAGFSNRSVNELSRGEKRRAAIAGVLACKPSVILFDEPTGDLDPRGRRQLAQIIKSLSQTLIIVTHDFSWVTTLCTRAILIDNGRIVAQGPIDELLANEAVMLEHGLECCKSV